MTETLLQTKLYIPPIRPNLVPRPRLIEQLNHGLITGKKLSLVSAPAGFGKSTLLSAWVQQAELQPRVAWLSLDEGDNDLVRFLTYFVAALQTINGDVGQGLLAALQSPGTVNAEIILTTLLNEISEFPDDVVIFLDDYHVIESQAIDKAIIFLLDHLPPQLHLVIATRVDPPLPLARLRALQKLTELRTASLCFTHDETAAFLNQGMNLDLSTEDIFVLETRSEGWIVGLQLAALSLQNSEDVTGFIQSFSGSHQHILDYLIEEVLSQRPPGTQSFLLQTSILERLSGPLCDAVCDYEIENVYQDGGQATLERLAKSNLFIVPLDDERRWYRYHHLFADLLRSRLKRLHPQRLATLHLRASEWFLENGLTAEAIDHALSAADYDRAASLIDQVASDRILGGHVNTILRWLDALPESLLDGRPRFRFYQAWALSIAGDSRTAEKIVTDAKSTLDHLPGSPENRALRGQLAALLTSIIVYSNDPVRVFQEAQEALAYLPEDDLNSRARVHIALGTAYAYSDELQKAAEIYQLTRDIALSAGNPFLATVAMDMFAELQVFHLGRLKETAHYLPQILELGRTAGGVLQTFTGTAHILLGEISLEWNNLEVASDYLERGLELLQQGGLGYSLIHSYCAKARLELARGDTRRAVKSLQSATRTTHSYPLMHMLIHNLAYQVKIFLYLGDIEMASRWAAGDMCDLPGSLPMYLHEVQQIALSRVYLAQNDLQKTIDTLDRIRPPAESDGRVAHAIAIYLLKALALREQGESTAAIKDLESALSLAAPEGYIRTFVEHGEPLAQLLREAADRGIAPTYVNRLLAAFDSQDQPEPPAPVDVKPTLASSPLVEPLSDRELEVLSLMTEGLTYNEIAGRILVSLNTVRTHVKNIYSKLLVHRRSEAIAKARELKLL